MALYTNKDFTVKWSTTTDITINESTDSIFRFAPATGTFASVEAATAKLYKKVSEGVYDPVTIDGTLIKIAMGTDTDAGKVVLTIKPTNTSGIAQDDVLSITFDATLAS